MGSDVASCYQVESSAFNLLLRISTVVQLATSSSVVLMSYLVAYMSHDKGCDNTTPLLPPVIHGPEYAVITLTTRLRNAISFAAQGNVVQIFEIAGNSSECQVTRNLRTHFREEIYVCNVE